MITSRKEYYDNLYRIQNAAINKPDKNLRVPADEKVYEINLNARTIQAPTYLSVVKDHTAETIFFKCDRYFDNVDLSNMVGVIQYINANNDGAIYPIPHYDITSEEGKMIFPWCISGHATAAAGVIKFAVRFYQIQPKYDSNNNLVDYVLTYNLNTQPQSSKILYGMDLTEELTDKYDIPTNILDEINERLMAYANSVDIYWIDISDMKDNHVELSEDDKKLMEILRPKLSSQAPSIENPDSVEDNTEEEAE